MAQTRRRLFPFVASLLTLTVLAITVSTSSVEPLLACMPTATPTGFDQDFQSIEDRTESSDLVIVGRVVAIPGYDDLGLMAWVEVEKYLKGEGPEKIKITGLGVDTDCRPGVRVGNRAIFFLDILEDQRVMIPPEFSTYGLAYADPENVDLISASANDLLSEPYQVAAVPEQGPVIGLLIVILVGLLIAGRAMRYSASR